MTGYASRAHDPTRTVVSEEPWLMAAECRGADTSLFFPTSGSGHKREPDDLLYADARRQCAPCSVKQECLGYAQRFGIEDGMFGGLTPTDRFLLSDMRHGIPWSFQRGCHCGPCTAAHDEAERRSRDARKAAS